MLTIYDKEGNEKDWDWLVARFGDVTISQSQAEQAYRVTALREKEGPASLVVKLLDENGNPVVKVPVVRFWPSAPELPQWEGLPERWRNKGVSGRTNDEGDIGFGMGGGDYYWPDQGQKGASGVWAGEPGWGSDFVLGLGMLAATNHIHLDVEFQRMIGDPGNGNGGEPPAGSDDLAEAIKYAGDQIRAGFEELAAAVSSEPTSDEWRELDGRLANIQSLLEAISTISD